MKKKGYIYYNEEKELACQLYQESLAYFAKRGVEILEKAEEAEADFYVVIGGDGTLLRAFRKFARLDLPVIAINAGHLGFLTEIKKEDMLLEYDNFLEGRARFQERHFLNIKIAGKSCRALNELVITRESITQNMVAVDVHAEGLFVNHYKGDGLIIATPTGSTAYSLSAGGPIVGAPLKLYCLTPIAPHNLSMRAFIMDGNPSLTLRFAKGEKALCIIDGDHKKELEDGTEISISYAKETLHLVVPRERDYYSVVREKLKWGENLC